MIAPRGLIGAALLIWGASVGFLPVAIVLALAYEGSRFAPPSAAAQKRVRLVGRVVVFAVLAKLAYVAVTSSFPEALYVWLRWLPILLIALPIVQSLCGGSISTASLPVPLQPGRGEPRAIDTTYIYAAIVLLAAGTGAAIETWFYAAVAAIVAWAIVARMDARTRVAGLAMLAVAIAAGYATHLGVRQAQDQVEEWSESLITDYFAGKADAMRERTRIGDIGKVKLSDRILMRVVPHGRRDMVLLREASFDRYFNGTWQNSVRVYKPVPREADRWVVRDGPQRREITIKRSLSGGEGVLALPSGAQVLGRLPAATIEMLPTGTIRASGTPHFLAMTVAYDESRESEKPLGDGDLSVPDLLAPALDQVIASEGLARASPAETLAAVQDFFAAKFAYSLNLSNPAGAKQGRSVADFLLRDRQGHCESFATATTLLLRRLGIPARYTVGYSVQEFSELERVFIVRNRHAHAWSAAFVDGRWREVDTTPATWAVNEGAEARSVFGPVMDAFSWLWDRVVDYWIEHTATQIAGTLASIAGFVAAVVAAVVVWHRRRRTSKPGAGPNDALSRAWRSLEARLARQGVKRAAGETPLAFARRIASGGEERWRADVLALARRYYGARFDPDAAASAGEVALAMRKWRPG